MLRVDLQFALDSEIRIRARGEFEAGDRVWLRAPSGFGKTSLFRVLAGVSPRTADDRLSILLGEKELSKLIPSERHIGWVPQGDSLFPGLSVPAQLELPLKWRKMERSEQLSWVRNQIEHFELQDLLETPVEKLSGGERARVAVARACGPGVKLILLDEPFAALDHEARERMEKVLVRNFSALFSEADAPILMVASHDPPVSSGFFTAVWQGTQHPNSRAREFSVVTG